MGICVLWIVRNDPPASLEPEATAGVPVVQCRANGHGEARVQDQTVHYRHPDGRIACASAHTGLTWTLNRDDATCEDCLNAPPAPTAQGLGRRWRGYRGRCPRHRRALVVLDAGLSPRR